MAPGDAPPEPESDLRFDLEPEAPRRPRALPDLPAPRPEAAPPPTGAPRAPQAGTASTGPAPAAETGAEGPVEGEAPAVDVRTFAEKQGRALPSAIVRPYPPGWPLEVLRYPLRGHGPALLAGTTAAIFVLDLLGWPDDLRFLSWLLKVPGLLFVVRWQFCLIGHSAGGRDEPVGWREAADLSHAGLTWFMKFLWWCFVLVLPSRVLWLFGPSVLGWIQGTGPYEVALLVIASAVMALVALSSALDEPRLKRPWVAAAWLWHKQLLLLAGSLGWWALGVAELSIASLAATDTWAALPAAVILRAVSIYALMASARLLGCLGRRYDPERIAPV